MLAAGSQPNFFGTPGADRNSFPLYSLHHAQRLRSRIIGVFEAADRDPSLIDRGALNFVIVGGGPTGVETAGALADMIDADDGGRVPRPGGRRRRGSTSSTWATPARPVLATRRTSTPSKVLRRKGVELHLGTKVTEVAPGHVTLGDGTEIATRCVVWGGGHHGARRLPPRPACRRDAAGASTCRPDLTVQGFPRLYAVGDVANIPGPDGKPLPQLGSVALQSGVWAAKTCSRTSPGSRRSRSSTRTRASWR